jgi:hypothetical protein
LLARLLLHDEQPAAAVAELERALIDLQAIAGQAQPIERERLLSSAQATLAEALAASEPTASERIASLASAAQTYFLQWPHAYARRLDNLAPLLSAPREPSHDPLD